MKDDPPLGYEGDMFEKTETRLGDREVSDLLADLLGEMLRYRADDSRITAAEVVRHPWFKYER